MRHFLRIGLCVVSCCVLGALAQFPAVRLLPAHTNMSSFLLSSDMPTARSTLGIPTVAATNLVFVNTITDVAAYTRENGLPEFIQTKGFTSVGDRGAALYKWVNSTAATNIYRINAVGGGRWIETDYLYRNICNVLKAGATPFDTTSDSAAIQLALDAAAQQSVGSGLSNLGDEPIIYIPSGRYYITDTLRYIASSRNAANIAIRGDGMYNTHLIAVGANFPTAGNKPVLYIENVRLNLRDFRIRGDWSGVPSDYRATGIHLKDCDYGVVRDVGVAGMSRGVVVDCGAMNWNTFSGLQFEANYVDVFAASAQGLNGEWHSTGSGHTWFGPANGLSLDIQCEGAGSYNEFTPAGIYLPAANNAYVRWGYNESSKAPFWLGVPLTNRVTLSTADGNVITATFTNAHYYVSGYTFTIQAEQAVPSDVQNYIVGSRTVATGFRTNNYVTFNSGGTVTSPLTGYTFLMIRDSVNDGVMNSKFYAKGQYNDTLPIFADKVRNAELFGGNIFLKKTERTRALVVKSTSDVTTDTFYDYDPLTVGPQKHIPANIFPDPNLSSGDGWASSVTLLNGGAYAVTNYNGQPGILLYVGSKPASSYAQWRINWKPVVPMSALNGRKLTFAWQVRELNHPAWRPNGFTVNAGGTGYTDGTATVTHNGRTVTVNLTTSAGAITAATWNFGAFTTNDATVANLSVTQGAASGGVITPTGFTDYSAYARRSYRVPAVRPAYWNENTSTLSINGVLVDLGASFGLDLDGTMRGGSIRGLYGPIDGAKSGFRMLFTDTSLDASNATGTEAIFVSFLGAYVDATLDNLELLQNNWYHRPFNFMHRFRSGIGSTMPYESGVAALFGANDASGNAGLRAINSLGGAGMLLYRLSDVPAGGSMPTNVTEGAIVRSNVTRYIYNGTGWEVF